MKRLALMLALLLTACGAFTDDPFRDAELNGVAVSPGGRALELGIGACNHYKLEVEETEDEVRIGARAWDDDGDCGGMEVELRLISPLGDRTVVDTNSDDPVEVTDCGICRNRRAPECTELLA